jgi:hypothetical protein
VPMFASERKRPVNRRRPSCPRYQESYHACPFGFAFSFH